MEDCYYYSVPKTVRCSQTLVGYSIIVLSGVCDVGSENHSTISGHMTSGEREFLIPVSAGFGESSDVIVSFFISKPCYVHTYIVSW